jgi:hypothetical protein
VSFTVNVTGNEPPVANVSLSQSNGSVDTPVSLNVTRSTDPEERPLAYNWEIITLPEGANAPIENATRSVTEFTPDTAGLYRVRLTVNDGLQDSAPVQFLVNVGQNQPPVADVSLSQSSGD